MEKKKTINKNIKIVLFIVLLFSFKARGIENCYINHSPYIFDPWLSCKYYTYNPNECNGVFYRDWGDGKYYTCIYDTGLEKCIKSTECVLSPCIGTLVENACNYYEDECSSKYWIRVGSSFDAYISCSDGFYSCTDNQLCEKTPPPSCIGDLAGTFKEGNTTYNYECGELSSEDCNNKYTVVPPQMHYTNMSSNQFIQCHYRGGMGCMDSVYCIKEDEENEEEYGGLECNISKSFIDLSEFPDNVLGVSLCSLLNIVSISIIIILTLIFSALYSIKGGLLGGVAGADFFAYMGWLAINPLFLLASNIVGLLMVLINRRNPQ